MVELCIAISVVVILSVASIWADKRFGRADRLPMQWSFAGEVNWTAPRRIALAFTPALAALVLGGIAILVLVSGEPRPGQEGFGAPVVLLIGLVFIGVHALHLWLIDRSVDKTS